MGGMSAVQRRFWYPKLVNKQGGSYCFGCGVTVHYQSDDETVNKLGLIDHIDNRKPHINKLDNLQILCRSCNRIKNPRKSFVSPIQATKSEVQNDLCEKPFRSWVFKYIQENGIISYSHAKNGGAEKFACSPETTRKYLDKMLSKEGIYTDDEHGNIIFKEPEELDQVILNDDELIAHSR